MTCTVILQWINRYVYLDGPTLAKISDTIQATVLQRVLCPPLITSSMRCKGCGTILREIQYQSRSADEGQTSAYRCPHCPLSIERFFNDRKEPHLYLQRSERHIQTTPFVDLETTEVQLVLRTTARSTGVETDSFVCKAMAYNVLDKDSRLFRSYTTGPWKALAVSRIESKRVTLNAELVTFHTAPYSQMQEGRLYCDFEFFEYGQGIITMEGKDTVYSQFIDRQSEKGILKKLSVAYSIAFVPDHLHT